MAITWITPVALTPSAQDAWTDMDVSANVPAGATGVILRVHSLVTTNDILAFRKNGSTDNRTGAANDLSGGGSTWAFVGVDASRIFEYYTQGTDNHRWDLVGYFDDDAVFLTNAIDKSVSTTGSYVDIDISGDTGADTAIGAIFAATTPSIAYFSIRKNGSTDDFTPFDLDNKYWPIIGVDASEICEIKQEAIADFFLIGYITKHATFLTNATDVTPGSTLTWTDTTLPVGATGGFLHFYGADDNQYGARKNGTSLAWNEPLVDEVGVVAVEADASRIIEVYKGTASVAAYLIGYSEAGASTTPVVNSTDLRWNTIETVESTLDARWNTVNSIIQAADLRWHLRNAV
ncbi:MAG: hypothetical protein KDD76_02035, partial [Rickettsiales bacterium]|nr:hypothetical protein [Rickettsiales bacterium]